MLRKIVIIGALTFTLSGIMLASENLNVEKLSRNAYAVLPKEGSQRAVSNSVFITFENSVLVIDSQASKELAEELLSEIKKVTAKPVEFLISTHFHRDHTGGNPFFFPPAQLILHSMTLERLKEDKNLLNEPTMSIRYELSLVGRNNDVQILWLGKGHTDGDILIHLPEEDVLVLGDLFFNEEIPYVKDSNIEEWLATLDRIIKKTKVSESMKIVPGHGPIGDFLALRRFRELLAWSRGVVSSELEKGTERANIIEAAKETKLFKMRLHKYNHQERLADFIDKVYQEFAGTSDEATVQQ